MQNDVGIPAGTVMRCERTSPIDLEKLAGLVRLDLDQPIQQPALPRLLVERCRRNREVMDNAIRLTPMHVVRVVADGVDAEGKTLRSLTAIEVLQSQRPARTI